MHRKLNLFMKVNVDLENNIQSYTIPVFYYYNFYRILLIMSSEKKLFCAFVDLKQGNALWSKLANTGISGKCFNYVKNMYMGIK